MRLQATPRRPDPVKDRARLLREVEIFVEYHLVYATIAAAEDPAREPLRRRAERARRAVLALKATERASGTGRSSPSARPRARSRRAR